MKTSLALLIASILAGSASAQILVTEHYTFNTSTTPGDGLGSPSSETRTISSSLITSITELAVTLNLVSDQAGGAFNGDYYISLQHGSGFSVLLNRVGRHDGTTPTATHGYGDNGMTVTFSDSAANGDIHNYRLTLAGDHLTPIDPNFELPLSGTWAPDGRTTSPVIVLASDARTALLNSFNNLGANGGWTLQAVDFDGGTIATIEKWELNITGTAVPEPLATTAFTALGLGVFAVARRRLRSQSDCR